MPDNEEPTSDPKAKFLEALEKKKHKNSSLPGGTSTSGSKVSKGQASGGAPGRFQRKSGSSGSAAG